MASGESEMEAFARKNPLIVFSVYSHIQADILRAEGLRLIETLDRAFADRGIVVGHLFNDAYAKFWLWSLGAYELTRTMSQHSKCFSEELAARTLTFKRHIALVRMPFAKQELAGNNGSLLVAEASVSAVDLDAKDLGFDVLGQRLWMRQCVGQLVDLLNSIKPDDVLARLGNT